MAEPDNKGNDKAVPPEGEPASGSAATTASAEQQAQAKASWAEVSNAMQSAEEAVSNAVQGIARNQNKQ
jgi:hypothetical protein